MALADAGDEPGPALAHADSAMKKPFSYLQLRRLIAILTLAIAFVPFAAVPALAQEQPQKEKEKIPYDEDPNVPGLSRAERIRRQQEYIRKKVQEGQEVRKTEALRRLEERLKEQQAGGAKPAAAAPGAPAPEEAKLLDAKPESEYRYVTLYFAPASEVVTVGEVFNTELHLINLDRLTIDRVDIVVKYAPGYLEPLAIHQSGIRGRLASEPEGWIDREAGEIHYSARFREPISPIDIALLDFVWKPLKPADDLKIELAAGAQRTAAYSGDDLISRNVFGEAGPLLAANVRINPPAKQLEPGGRMVENPARDFVPAVSSELSSIGKTPPSLRLDYERKDLYEAGEWIVIDVVLENPDLSSLDEVRLALRYDPQSLEIVDSDRSNWLTSGDNILDGPFRQHWPWDTHLLNVIRKERGIIEYRMANTRPLNRPTGAVARIFARVKTLVQDPPLTWIRSSDAKAETLSTGVYLFGNDVLHSIDEKFVGGKFVPEKADPADYQF